MNTSKSFWLFVQVLALCLLLGGLAKATATSAEACWQCRLSGSTVWCDQNGSNAVCYVDCGGQGPGSCVCTSGGGTCFASQEKQRRQLEALGSTEGTLRKKDLSQ